MAAGTLSGHVQVDALGGAGTSTNMAVNEVIANRALQLLRLEPGRYEVVSPLDDINLHPVHQRHLSDGLEAGGHPQLKVVETGCWPFKRLFQSKEKAFAHIVKMGRTQLQDAVLTTLGREMGAYAEALNRDRWRIYKCEERLRVVNLGGTAVGTGIGLRGSSSSGPRMPFGIRPASASRAPRTSPRPRRTPTCSSRSPASSRPTR